MSNKLLAVLIVYGLGMAAGMLLSAGHPWLGVFLSAVTGAWVSTWKDMV